MNLGRLLDKAVAVVKKNPELALLVVGALAPKAAAKVVATVAKVKAAKL